MASKNGNGKSLESWIWDAACSIRGAQDLLKYKDFIMPLVFYKGLCDVYDDELNRIAETVGSRAKAFKLVERDQNLSLRQSVRQPFSKDSLNTYKERWIGKSLIPKPETEPVVPAEPLPAAS